MKKGRRNSHQTPKKKKENPKVFLASKIAAGGTIHIKKDHDRGDSGTGEKWWDNKVRRGEKENPPATIKGLKGPRPFSPPHRGKKKRQEATHNESHRGALNQSQIPAEYPTRGGIENHAVDPTRNKKKKQGLKKSKAKKKEQEKKDRKKSPCRTANATGGRHFGMVSAGQK